MEFHGERNNNNHHHLWTFMDDERKSINLPRRLSFTGHNHHHHHNHGSPARRSVASAAMPMSPDRGGGGSETPWTLSPVRTSPAQALMYHCIASLHRHEGNIFSVAIAGDLVFTGSESSRVHAWKLPDCTEMGHIRASSGHVRAISAHSNTLFTAHADFKLRVWDLSRDHRRHRHHHHHKIASFKPKKIATLPQRNPLSLFSSSKKSSGYNNLHHHRDHVSCMAYNPDDKLLYTGSWDRTVKAWKVNEKRCVDSFVAHEGHVNAIVVNREDGCVFTCSSDGSVKIWRRVFGESSHMLTVTLKFQLSPVNALALSSSSPGSYLLYSGSSDGIINFWEKEESSGRYSHGGFMQGHHFAVLCLVAVGELVFSGSEDATIRVWRREGGNCFHACLAVVEGHHGPVRCLAVSLETESSVKGLLVYSASLDQTFKVWRVKVFPSEKTCGFDEATGAVADPQREVVGDDPVLSPVLSPSWVEKKLQGNHF